jgi:hypothetical protein
MASTQSATSAATVAATLDPNIQIVANVLACEAGGDDSQAIDIAYVIQSRMRAGVGGSTAVQVVTYPGAFQCKGQQSPFAPTATMLELARALVGNNIHSPLPYPPSDPRLQSALYTYGVQYQGRAGQDASAISDATIVANLVHDKVCGAPNLNGLEITHSNFNNQGYTTVFFSDDPQCSLK